ncbi:Type I restriction enzyme EcoKI specificity protein [uncultured Roseburia sp.]|uniref:Restriction endonuclease subunit S n=1 Tax=Brotonthovivens ammoniilytica TaxID=2981725 RepID=A0ABT2TLS8_9FIRM|nr:restriction endonuclease subunit S [Brotonthovivens ammoniilytica]MCU6763174.1 restriction endonuclease subunit S [Brotonthovivens ammoniilytica]SCJ05713.1 Type I restriction enzyme EcoKI specificity protein [uncultured Roseburia sp.]
MAKLIDITGRALSGEWGADDETGDGTPVLRTTNFTNKGSVDYNNVVTRCITKKNIDEKYLCQGDIIIEKSGGSDKQPVGRVIYFEGPEKTYLFNNFTGLLRVKDIKQWFPKYVFYSLYGNYRRGGTRPFENKTTGLHNLKTDDYVSCYEVADIDIIEQVQICEKLDKLKEIIKKRKVQLEQLDLLIKSRFVEMFGDMTGNTNGWEKKLLGEVCDVRDGTHDSPKYVMDDGYPLVTSKNVSTGKIDFTDCSLICREDLNKINSRSKVDLGDILMPMIGTVGNPVIVDVDKEFAIKNVALIKFVEDSLVNNIFVKALLQSDYFDSAVLSKVKGGTQKFISLGDIRKLEIALPPLELQNNFSDFVNQVDKSKFHEFRHFY